MRSALGYAQVALFVSTSSAALGIAFKASLMLCSHLHEQSGRTRRPWCASFQSGVKMSMQLLMKKCGHLVRDDHTPR